MVEDTTRTRNTLGRALIRAHDAVAALAPRTRCFWCARPLADGLCATCDAVGLERGAEDGESGCWR